ncbi:hypothetical protein JTE90_007421 [Oedothorax gibbosus]|uniref:Reverse transcriptase/retrotransposon-derived protein RNase H-like domain-containing protein n=1 Tax=Oedothorax gibbosus TaxID=931172 RepID=A0AAV6TMX3_9ARAC|nr:hypothetical protein JTE90_007421 [Oedothorax gibbosus]
MIWKLNITNPSSIGVSTPHDTVHHIITKGPPVTARPRRLHPKSHDAVKAEFEFLLSQGIIRPSKSPWSSPLHVVPKQDSTVRPVGDYRRLNSVTEFDSLKGSKGKRDNRRIDWTPQAVAAFEKCKQTLAETTLLCHPAPSAPLALHVDASDFAIGGALHQSSTEKKFSQHCITWHTQASDAPCTC